MSLIMDKLEQNGFSTNPHNIELVKIFASSGTEALSVNLQDPKKPIYFKTFVPGGQELDG